MKQRFQPTEGWVMPEDGIEIIKEGADIIIRFGEAAVDEPDMTNQVECEQVTVHHPVFYGDLVSKIIGQRYSEDQIQAIINNHILKEDNPEHEAEFSAMQEYRAFAKRTARTIVNRLSS